MLPNNMARVPLEKLQVASLERPGWHSGSERMPCVGENVQCIEGEAEVGIMGVGGSISGYIIDNIQSSYEALPGVVEAWKAAQAEKAGAAAE